MIKSWVRVSSSRLCEVGDLDEPSLALRKMGVMDIG